MCIIAQIHIYSLYIQCSFVPSLISGQDLQCFGTLSCAHSTITSINGVIGCYAHASCMRTIIQSSSNIVVDGAYGLINGILFYFCFTACILFLDLDIFHSLCRFFIRSLFCFFFVRYVLQLLVVFVVIVNVVNFIWNICFDSFVTYKDISMVAIQ